MKLRWIHWTPRVAVAGILAATVALVPTSGVRTFDTELVKIDYASDIDHPKNIVWVLAMGSDARRGELITRTRADAIQLIGVNLETGTGVVIGTPRDSWVPIEDTAPTGSTPRSTSGTAADGQDGGELYGIDIDYALITGFSGFERMIQAIGGVTVDSALAFSDDNLPGRYKVGKNYVNGTRALNFGRMRHFLPAGDFDRSANQGRLVKAIFSKVKAKQDVPGFFEAGMLAAVTELRTNLSPAELYRVGQLVRNVKPGKIRTCVLSGSIGTVGEASVVLPNVTAARALGEDVRDDAKLDGPC